MQGGDAALSDFKRRKQVKIRVSKKQKGSSLRLGLEQVKGVGCIVLGLVSMTWHVGQCLKVHSTIGYNETG